LRRAERIGILILLILVTSCVPSGPLIKIEPSGSALQVNQTIQTSVRVEHIADLNAFEVHLSFDANTLEVMELKDGGFLKADFVVQKTFDNTAGTIDYAVAQINHPPVSGSGTLLEIVFRAAAQGEGPIRFRETPAVPQGALFSNSRGVAIEVSLMNGSLNVSDP
jgi:hypothetical protein